MHLYLLSALTSVSHFAWYVRTLPGGAPILFRGLWVGGRAHLWDQRKVSWFSFSFPALDFLVVV